MGCEHCKKPKPKRQFSKLHVVFANFFVSFVWLSNIVLRLKGFEPISELAITIVTVYGAFATGGYFTLCAIRDCSYNKREALLHKYEHKGGGV
jgi:hypothetical protein